MYFIAFYLFWLFVKFTLTKLKSNKLDQSIRLAQTKLNQNELDLRCLKVLHYSWSWTAKKIHADWGAGTLRGQKLLLMRPLLEPEPVITFFSIQSQHDPRVQLISNNICICQTDLNCLSNVETAANWIRLLNSKLRDNYFLKTYQH